MSPHADLCFFLAIGWLAIVAAPKGRFDVLGATITSWEIYHLFFTALGPFMVPIYAYCRSRTAAHYRPYNYCVLKWLLCTVLYWIVRIYVISQIHSPRKYNDPMFFVVLYARIILAVCWFELFRDWQRMLSAAYDFLAALPENLVLGSIFYAAAFARSIGSFLSANAAPMLPAVLLDFCAAIPSKMHMLSAKLLDFCAAIPSKVRMLSTKNLKFCAAIPSTMRMKFLKFCAVIPSKMRMLDAKLHKSFAAIPSKMRMLDAKLRNFFIAVRCKQASFKRQERDVSLPCTIQSHMGPLCATWLRSLPLLSSVI